MPPKYSLPEIERRWLVDLSAIDLESLGRAEIIVDRYVVGTRLRLRKMCGETTIYKLVKKYGREGWVEPITNLYLDSTEYELLCNLPANEVTKNRFHFANGSLDVYRFETETIGIFEIEFLSLEEAQSFSPPHFVVRELLDEDDNTGVSLALRRRN